ncbi:MAG TPA: hypothetical protein VFL93_14095 [Longimicrobiaceae bacterium]|jgi:hypothetical protein|nr:hypothetical protein [Longimicrobiaceae bacterium]
MRIRPAIALLALGLSLAACGDSTGPGSARLSETQARALADAVASSSLAATSEVSMSPSPVGSAARADLVPDDSASRFILPCPHGGSILFTTAPSGSSGPDTLSLRTSTVEIHRACVVQIHGVPYTLDGDPQIDIATSVSYGEDPGVFALPIIATVTQRGGVRWSSPDGSGHCDVDLSTTLDTVHAVTSLHGSFCGYPVDEDHPFGS